MDICVTMDPPERLDRPTKRRRTRNCIIWEGDEATAEGFLIWTTICDTDHGPLEEVTKHPIWKNRTQPGKDCIPDVPSSQDAAEPNPEYEIFPDHEPVRTQHYYLQEFVNQIHPMLNALLSREVLPTLVCRRCMQETHMDNPLHRIEVWTEGYFRSAELWETGVYILIPHHSGEPG